MYKLTIFTPTYNRASYLPYLYKNIKSQNYNRQYFEWFIVNDGSDDNTKEVIAGFIKEDILNIRYLEKENGGVHTAWNAGVKNADSEFFFRCDSDDLLEKGALKRIDQYMEQIKDQNLAGVCGLCKVIGTDMIAGNKFPADEIDSTGLELIYRFKVTGEKAGCYKTEILKQFPLPEPPDVKFIYESTMWRRIDQNYKTRFVNDVFKLYRLNGTDSITRQIKNRQTKNYYSSKYYYYKSGLNEIYNYLKTDKKNLYINIFGVCKNGIYSGRSMKTIIKEVNPFYAKCLIISGYPFFKIIHIINRRVKK